MNIGFFFNGRIYPPKAGGTVHAYQISSQLTKLGHQVSTYQYDYTAPSLTLYRRRELFKFLKEIDLLYIRVHGELDKEKYSRLKILTGMKLPIVWEVNTPLEEGLETGKSLSEVKKLTRKRKRLAHYVNATICTCKEIKHYAQNVLEIEDSTVVENGSDPELFSPEKRTEKIYPPFKDKLKVVWAGTTHFKWHGFDLIMKIAQEVNQIDKDVVFIIIGKKENLSVPVECEQYMHFVEPKDYLDLPPYLASADVGLCFYGKGQTGMPFYRSPLKLFDYLASGLSVLATNVGQIKEVIEDQKNGYLINEGDVKTSVQTILNLKKDKNLRDEMGAKARQSVLSYYNWERAAKQTEAVFKRVIT